MPDTLETLSESEQPIVPEHPTKPETLYPIDKWKPFTGNGKTKNFELVKTGKIEVVRIGDNRRVFATGTALRRYQETLFKNAEAAA